MIASEKRPDAHSELLLSMCTYSPRPRVNRYPLRPPRARYAEAGWSLGGTDGAMYRTNMTGLCRTTRCSPHPRRRNPRASRGFVSSGGGIRTRDLRVMSPTSYLTAPPRVATNECSSRQEVVKARKKCAGAPPGWAGRLLWCRRARRHVLGLARPLRVAQRDGRAVRVRAQLLVRADELRRARPSRGLAAQPVAAWQDPRRELLGLPAPPRRTAHPGGAPAHFLRALETCLGSSTFVRRDAGWGGPVSSSGS